MKTIKRAMAVLSAAFCVLAQAGTFYVAENGDDGADGSSEAPFATIAAGVSAAAASSAPRKVIVRTGTYKISEVISIPNAAMLIESETGNPVDVVIDGQGVTPVLKWTNWNSEIIVSGITVANGFLGYGNGNKYESAGIAMMGGTVTNCIVRDCVISAGAASAGGAGIKTGSELRCHIYDTTVGRCIVSNFNAAASNSGAVSGGGVWLDKDSDMKGCTVEDCKVQWCCAITSENAGGYQVSAGGGGIYAQQGGLIAETIVRNCIATNAHTTGWAGGGGGIYAASGTIVSNCLVQGCSASLSGGGIFANASDVVCCTVTNNSVRPVFNSQVYSDGGGVALYGTGSTLSRSRVAFNTVTRFSGMSKEQQGGGGVSIVGTNAKVVDCIVEKNTAYKGGGFYIGPGNSGGAAADGLVSNCVIRANTAVDNLGAAGAEPTGAAFQMYKAGGVSVVDSLITDNASVYSSCCYMPNCSVNAGGALFRNCFIAGGKATATSAGGSVFTHSTGNAYDYPLVIDHCTIVSNTVRDRVLYPYNSVSNVYVHGSVFYGNRSSANQTVYIAKVNSGTAVSSTTNCWWNFTDTSNSGFSTDSRYGNFNTLTASSFVDAAAGDYRLVKSSGAIDKGGPAEGWMGNGQKRGPLDMGDGTMTVVPDEDGGYGISNVRNNAVPRLSNLPEPGCFELWSPLGFMMMFR